MNRGTYELRPEAIDHGCPRVRRAYARSEDAAVTSALGHIPAQRYDLESWHYVLRNEPYPDTYFDLAIS
jgi:D-alanyl-D-alanine dipeptidase